MKKILSMTAALALLVPAAATAERPSSPGSQGKGKTPSSKGRCGKVNKGYVVAGTLVSHTLTQNPDGTYDGTVTVKVTKANSHAKKSGATTDSEQTYTLDDDKVSFGEGVTDGADEGTDVGLADVVAGDKVRVLGKIAVQKKGSKKKACPGDRYGAVDVRKVGFKRDAPEQPAPTTTP